MHQAGFVCAVEGLWHVGKTMLCRQLCDYYPSAEYITEPDHLILPSVDLGAADIEMWYLDEWRRRAEQATNYKQSGKLVVMERTLFSTLAYMAAIGRPIAIPMRSVSALPRSFLPDLVIVIDADSPRPELLPEAVLLRYKEAGVRIGDQSWLRMYKNALISFMTENGIPLQFIHGDLLSSRDYVLFDQAKILLVKHLGVLSCS